MMEKNNIKLQSMSDLALLAEIGAFIRHHRLEQNKSQEELANSAGINRSTLVQIEKGKGGNLLTLVQILRALTLLDKLDIFQIINEASPLLLAKLEANKRKRASAKKINKVNKK